MEITKEIKHIASAIIGDINVSINIEYLPMTPTRSMEDKLMLDRVNAELAQLGGEIGYEVKKIIKEKLSNPYRS